MRKKNVKSADAELGQEGEVVPEGGEKSLSLRRLPRQTRSLQTFQTILDVASAEIQRDGLDRLTTNKIAAAAGMGVGTVYGYFPNKEAIVGALLSQWMSAIYEFVVALHPAQGGPKQLFGYLVAMSEGAVELYEKQSGLGVLLDMMPAIPALWEEARAHDEKVVQSIASGLAHHVPGAPPGEVDAVARCLFSMTHEVCMAIVVDRKADRGRMIKYLHVAAFAMASQLALQAAVAAESA